MNSDSIVAIITAFIGAISSVVVAQLSIKKALQQKEVEEARMLQSFNDRLGQLEKQQEQHTMLVEKLNNIENTVIGVKKDIEYLKERNK